MIASETAPQEPREEPPVNAVLEKFHKWLYIGDDYNVIGPLTAVIANFAPGEPDIIGIIGPSGSGKTEFIRSLGNEPNKYIYPISSITEKTLISGFDQSDKIDLGPKLYSNGVHRILAIKDMTTLLSKTNDVRGQIFSQFREMTDGYLSQVYGNGVAKNYTNLRSSILFASTNAIESYYSMYSNLGQRLIFIRPVNDARRSMEKARQNIGHEDVMRDELHITVTEFIEKMIEVVERDGLPKIPENFDMDMFDLFFFLSMVRTTIKTDFKGDIAEIPEPEFPTRIAKTCTRLCQVHALINGRHEVAEPDYAFVKRLIMDNVPTQRLRLLQVIGDDWLPTSIIAKMARLPTSTSKRILDELQALGAVDRLPKGDHDGNYYDGRSDSYRIVSEYRSIMRLIEG